MKAPTSRVARQVDALAEDAAQHREADALAARREAREEGLALGRRPCRAACAPRRHRRDGAARSACGGLLQVVEAAEERQVVARPRARTARRSMLDQARERARRGRAQRVETSRRDAHLQLLARRRASRRRAVAVSSGRPERVAVEARRASAWPRSSAVAARSGEARPQEAAPAPGCAAHSVAARRRRRGVQRRTANARRRTRAGARNAARRRRSSCSAAVGSRRAASAKCSADRGGRLLQRRVPAPSGSCRRARGTALACASRSARHSRVQRVERASSSAGGAGARSAPQRPLRRARPMYMRARPLDQVVRLVDQHAPRASRSSRASAVQQGAARRSSSCSRRRPRRTSAPAPAPGSRGRPGARARCCAQRSAGPARRRQRGLGARGGQAVVEAARQRAGRRRGRPCPGARRPSRAPRARARAAGRAAPRAASQARPARARGPSVLAVRKKMLVDAPARGLGLEQREQRASVLPMPVGACASRQRPRARGAVDRLRQLALAGAEAGVRKGQRGQRRVALRAVRELLLAPRRGSASHSASKCGAQRRRACSVSAQHASRSRVSEVEVDQRHLDAGQRRAARTAASRRPGPAPSAARGGWPDGARASPR